MNHRVVFVLAAVAGLASCASIPAKLPPPDLRTTAPLAGLPVTNTASWPAAHWWKRYQDPQLDKLIEQAMQGSTSLATARSRVLQAEQAARISAVSNGVHIAGNTSLSRQRLSEHGLIPAQFLDFTWYTQTDLGVQLDYDFDWWGKHHASMASALGQARAALAQQSAAATALQAAVADTYFGWLADQTRLKLARQHVATQKQALRIASLRVKAGLESADPRLTAQLQLAAAQQQSEQIRGTAAIRLASLAALLGKAPAELPPLQVQPLPGGTDRLPGSASIDLISRRADIAASRWRVEAALRDTDVARTAFLPDLSISALAGLSSISLDQLFDASSRVFALTPALHLPIFEGGLLKARYGLSQVKLDAAIADYDDVVINAAHEVATQTLTLQNLTAMQAQQQQQLAAAQKMAHQTGARYQRGTTDIEPVLQARLQILQQRDAATVIKGRVLSADVALIRALGGGYRSGQADAGISKLSHSTDKTP